MASARRTSPSTPRSGGSSSRHGGSPPRGKPSAVPGPPRALWRVAFSVAVAVAVGAVDPAAAQAPRPIADPGGHPFRTPASSPLEPLIRLSIAHVARDTADRAVALPELGERLPFWLHRDSVGAWELAGSVAGGVFSRFDLESTDNEFIEVHYRVGLQLRARYRGVALRGELYHASSHLGDEYLVRTGRQPISTSREGVELLLQGAPLPGLMLYGGPGVLIRSTSSFDPLSLRGGLEWTARRSAVVPFLAADLFAWSELDWDPQFALEGGVVLGRHVRLALGYGNGPSRAEQFFRERERLWAISFVYRH